MKRILFIISTIFLVSCSNETIDMSAVGTWKLTGYNVSNGFDLNNDGIKSLNLLNEFECENHETLTFELNGVVSSTETFNPEVDVILIDEATNEYAFNVVCDIEGVIGFASNYSQNGEIVTYNNKNATIIGNELSVVFEDAIKIYNSDSTQVVSTENLTLVYTKQ
ncbi:hypothetical protein V8G69_03935 [Gaetbulibacter sp. M235]|uniref:hypothetical protein n=1 Tax=Gaetbulibacter sp. M235 TaxID=3126510 RepID=UPI00374F55A3